MNKINHKRAAITTFILIFITLQQLIFIDLSQNTFLNNSDTNLSKNDTERTNLFPFSQLNQFDNQSYRYIILLDNESETLSEIQTEFEANGGEIINTNWGFLNGFCGRINNSYANLGNFISANQQIDIFLDPIIETQMNTVHEQLNDFPAEAIQSNHLGLGDKNSSIAFLDSGIDDSQIVFNKSYDELNFSSTIIGWKDFTSENFVLPTDVYGHGTSIAAIATGSANKSLETNHTNSEYYLSVGGSFSHIDMFYPNHITPNWYTIKIASFIMDSSALDFLNIQGLLSNTIELSNYRLELYRNDQEINTTNDITEGVSWDTSGIFNTIKKDGMYDVYFSYEKIFGQNPLFDLYINITFTPTEFSKDYSNFAGIAPETSITALKILNSSGIGFGSDLISSLEWVLENSSSYHIITSVLSIANFDMPMELASKISELITQIIDNGTMVIIAAGNNGISSKAYNLLARNEKALVVGSINNQDQVTYYSSQGIELTSEQSEWYDDGILIKPDVVAPGGSILSNSEMVITAQSNDVIYNTPHGISIADDLTCITGTSVSAAIVAGIYSQIAALWGGWSTWNRTNGYSALKAKALLLMTATETNLEREDNPLTSFTENSISPELNRGSPDKSEGYGRINPDQIAQLSSTSFPINSSIDISITASNVDPNGIHAYAINITLEKEKIYRFELNNHENLFSNFDADLYLYDTEPDQYGRPILLMSHPETGSIDEYFYYCNIEENKTFFLIAKAISGEGNLDINVTQTQLLDSPNLHEANYTLLTNSDYNDLLDTFRFTINYTQSENIPASKILITFNASAGIFPLIPISNTDRNITNGYVYYLDIKFNVSGFYSYNFTVQTGHYILNYEDPILNVTNINPIYHLVNSSYQSNFSSFDNLWDYENTNQTILFNSEITNIISGWNYVSIPNQLENRSYNYDNERWGGLYYGISKLSNMYFEPLSANNQLIYRYSNLSDNLILTSPIIYLNNTEINQPLVKFGIRLSIDSDDSLTIQLRENRTNWVTMDEFSGIEQDWSQIEYNLTEYVDSYIQFRFVMNTNGNPIEYDKGIFIDEINFEDYESQTPSSQILSKLIDSFNSNSYLPDYTSLSDNKFGNYQFQANYSNTNGQLPEWVYLEINNKNYSMSNFYGIWNSSRINGEVSGIIFKYSCPIYYMNNLSYRFHASDGMNIISTNWSIVTYSDEYSPLNFPVLSPMDSNTWTIIEPGKPIFDSYWIRSNATWHTLKNISADQSEEIWYCGIGEYLGYGYNYSSNLITPVVNLNGTNEIFLNFTQRLRFDTEGNENGDYAEIFISIDYGNSWIRLAKFESETIGTIDEKIAIEITDYNRENAIFRFKFTSDDTGTQVKNSGWKLRNIVVDINRTKDYIDPSIQFLGIQDGDTISSILEFQILITDNIGIASDKTELWIDNELVNFTISDGIISYSFDTTTISNGKNIEIICIAYDLEGNREILKIYVTVKNPINNFQLFIIILLSTISISFVSYLYLRERQIKKLLLTGDYIRKPSFIERRNQIKFEADKIRQESNIILSKIDKNWEISQPIRLHCKKCKKDFESPTFDIFCPACLKDSLYIARFCPACKKWNYYKEEASQLRCKTCKLELFKDYSKTKEYLLNHEELNEKLTVSDEKLDEFYEIAKDIPEDKINEYLSRILEDNKGGN